MSLHEKTTKPAATVARRSTPGNTFFRKPGEGFFNRAGTLFPIQRKLSVNTPGDAHEKEADTVADKVMRMPATQDKEKGLQRTEDKREEDKMQIGAIDHAPLQRKNMEWERDPMRTGEVDAAPLSRQGVGMKDEEDHMIDGSTDLAPLQRKDEEQLQAKGDGTPAVSPSFEQGLQSSKGGGSPLPGDVQRQMETGIGADFSNVRIHTGTKAAQLSSNIQAQAFTHGSDIYFNEGKYSPGTNSGKHLLAHELTHTVQQKAAPAIQRAFKPEDAAAEMVGKKFTINTAFTYLKTAIPVNTEITITTWSNSSHFVSGMVYLNTGLTKSVPQTISVDKRYLSTTRTSVTGISGYAAGVKGTETKMAAADKKLSDFKAREPEYQKAKTMKIFNAEVANQQSLQDNRYTDLNQKLIQETMFNAFDTQIKNWVDYYHASIGTAKGWTKVDYNLVKSMIFQESSMGTAGTYLYTSPRYDGDPMTRFNLTQSIDSSGAILTRMMKEMDPALATKYKLDEVTQDMYKAQKRFTELKGKTKPTAAEAAELATLKQRCAYDETDKKAHWDNYYWSDTTRFLPGWREFNKQPTKQKTPGKMRNLDYDFWIRTGVRWLYEKRDGVSSWEAAVKAFNGSGTDAENYKKEVTGRRDAAVKGNNAYIPTH